MNEGSAKRPSTAAVKQEPRTLSLQSEFDKILQEALTDNKFYQDAAFKKLFAKKQQHPTFDFDLFIEQNYDPDFNALVKEGLSRQERRQKYSSGISQPSKISPPKQQTIGIPRPTTQKSLTLSESTLNDGTSQHNQNQEYQERKNKLNQY